MEAANDGIWNVYGDEFRLLRTDGVIRTNGCDPAEEICLLFYLRESVWFGRDDISHRTIETTASNWRSQSNDCQRSLLRVNGTDASRSSEVEKQRSRVRILRASDRITSLVLAVIHSLRKTSCFNVLGASLEGLFVCLSPSRYRMRSLLRFTIQSIGTSHEIYK